MVNWDEAFEFCRKLNELPQERAIRATYRLPTEAEWEYACRAGTTTNWYGGEDETTLTAQAWFGPNAGGTTHPTRRKTANAWGLYDMHGNVWEWCQDRRDADYYAKSPFDDPTGAEAGSGRVIRGGGWPDAAGLCRSAYRRGGQPGHRSGILGFRLARSAPDRAQKTMGNWKPADGSNESTDSPAASVPGSNAPQRSLADLLKEGTVERRTQQAPTSMDSASRVPAASTLSAGGLKPPQGAIMLMTFESDTFVPKSGRVHVKDLSDAGHMGEMHGAKVVAARVGKGLEFDGNSSVMVSGRFPSGGSPRTISAWILCTSQQGCTVLFYGVPVIGRAFGFIAWGGLDDGQWAFLGYGCGLPTGMRVDANWHHHVISFDGTDVEYYFDAERKLRSPARDVGGQREIIRLDTAPEPMQLGMPLNETSRAFIGKLDELAVFDRVLSAEEVQTLYEMGLQGTLLAK